LFGGLYEAHEYITISVSISIRKQMQLIGINISQMDRALINTEYMHLSMVDNMLERNGLFD
jgi:hypothetical protein